jgi:predicted pyridoxine 5'-phosphate oxidase superfamily flavin-nucleotide-binding protein
MQSRVGVRDKLEELGTRMIRDHMPDQHRELFGKLPMVLLGSIDDDGQPWASVLARAQGLMTSNDGSALAIHALPLADDPLARNLRPGAPIGMLGIEPHTRRRNRMNGIAADIDQQGFVLQVKQSFGNCPKYIQARTPQPRDVASSDVVAERGSSLSAAMMKIVAQADTYFIASAYLGEGAAAASFDASDPRHGVDVSHRGGKPGFVRIDDANTLTAPDFIGNYFFNTLGNITAYPKAGLLFIDFDSGDLLYLAVSAEIIFDPEPIAEYTGALRLLRFAIRQAILLPQALPLCWSEPQASPVLAATGSWSGTESRAGEETE